MMRKLNKGVTIVEVLIALAIFLVLMVPLVSGLVAGMKTSTKGKEVQYRNEYAKNLMENVKEVSIDVLKNKETSYFENLGSTTVTMTDLSGGKDGYQIEGYSYIGLERTPYKYVIELDRSAFPQYNGMSNGTVENLNKTDTALISARFVNYDDPARDELLTLKLAELRKRKEQARKSHPEPKRSSYSSDAAYEAALETYNTNYPEFNPITDVTVFNNDTGNRNINIAVSGNASNGYTVACKVLYTDNSTVMAANGNAIGKEIGSIEYNIYSEHFDKMPNVYLMYNVCVYNGRYASEYITYDLSGLDEDTEVNVFVLETAEKYSADIKKGKDDLVEAGETPTEDTEWLPGGDNVLYKNAKSGARDLVVTGQEPLKIGMAVSNNGLGNKKGNLHVYHNMILPEKKTGMTDSEYAEIMAAWEKHKKNTTISFDDAVAASVGTLFAGTGTYSNLSSQVMSLDSSMKDARSLYKVKVWMEEVSSVAAAPSASELMQKDPILQGTRGGGEID